MKLSALGICITSLFFSSFVMATTLHNTQTERTVEMFEVNNNGIGKRLGTVQISTTKYGLLFTPDLTGLVPGKHGFHIHQMPDCMSMNHTAAGAAGTHYDPAKTNSHGGPYGEGHLGDLPELYVDTNGTAVSSVLAPRLHKIQEVTGHSLMIHAGPDNFANDAGGARVVCGVIK